MNHLLTSALLLASLCAALPATAQSEKKPEGSEFIDMPEDAAAPGDAAEPAAEPEDEKEAPGYVPGYRRPLALGLSPHAPSRASALPGGLTPSYGAPVPSRAYKFEFHGYIQVPVKASLGERDRAYDHQQTMTLHGDPVVAGSSWGWFDHTNTLTSPWSDLKFYYGNDKVQAAVHFGAWGLSESDQAAGAAMPKAQVGITDAYLTYRPLLFDPIALELRVGAYRDRYGAMSKYSEGAYSISLIGSITGIGTTATVVVPFEYDIDLHLEGGFKGELSKPPYGIVQDDSNEYALPQQGSTLAAHGHVGLGDKDGWFLPMVHLIHTWSQDDRGDPRDDEDTAINESRGSPDGKLTIIGADLRMDARRFGYFYFGAQRTKGVDSVRVSDMVKVINAGGGKQLMEYHWGFESNGTGELLLVGGQYGLSLGTLLRHPMEFYGEGPDLHVGVFGLYGQVKSPVAEFDGRQMYKYGAELTYSMTSWLAASGRFDHVMPDTEDATRSFAVVSPKLIFRTDWNTREALTLQYATYFLGSNVRVEGDTRLVSTPSGKPDRHLFSLAGTLWW